jgi:hypothetical protein
MFIRRLIGRRDRPCASRAPAALAALAAWALILAGGRGTAHAELLDGGVDPANLGKGEWIYVLSAATNHLGGSVDVVHDVPSLMAFFKSEGFQYIVVKAGTGAMDFNAGGASPQFDSILVWQAHAAGLRIFGYTRSLGQDVPGEIRLASRVYALGADGFVLDAEAEWEGDSPWIGTNGPALAATLCSGIKSLWPSKFLAHAPMPIISIHPTFPYKEFGLYCDAVMPQAYWREFKKTPADTVDWMDSVWLAFQASLKGSDTNAIKPLAPIGQADEPGISGAQIREYLERLRTDPHPATAGGYHGCSFWRAEAHAPETWAAAATNNIAAPATNPPAIWSLTAEDITDTSATIRWASDIPADDVVEFGPTAAYGTAITNAAATTAHAARLCGLTPDTTWHYRVICRGAASVQSASGDCLFTTLPEGIVSDIVLDESDATLMGRWITGTAGGEKHGAWYRYKRAGGGAGWAQFTPQILVPGEYEVYEWHPSGRNRPVAATYTVTSTNGAQTVLVDQQTRGGRWNLLGTFPLAAGAAGNVRITDAFSGPANEVVVADAIRFVHVAPARPSSPPLFANDLLQVSLAAKTEPAPSPATVATNQWSGWPAITDGPGTNGWQETGPGVPSNPALQVPLR